MDHGAHVHIDHFKLLCRTGFREISVDSEAAVVDKKDLARGRLAAEEVPNFQQAP
jgi:hypothetical protein